MVGKSARVHVGEVRASQQGCKARQWVARVGIVVGGGVSEH